MLAAVLLAGIRAPRHRAASRQHPLRDVREGAAFVLRHGLLRPILATQFIFNTALFVIHAVYVPYAIHRLGLSATGVGLTLAAFGVGMVVGALLCGATDGAAQSRYGHRDRPDLRLRGGAS